MEGRSNNSLQSYQYVLFNSKKLVILAVMYVLVTVWPFVEKNLITKPEQKFEDHFKSTKRNRSTPRSSIDNNCSLLRLSNFNEMSYKEYQQSIDEKDEDEKLSKFYNITLPRRSLLQAPTSSIPKAYLWTL